MHCILYIKEHAEQGSIGFTRLPRQSGHRKGQEEQPAGGLGQEVIGLESARRRVAKQSWTELRDQILRDLEGHFDFLL